MRLDDDGALWFASAAVAQMQDVVAARIFLIGRTTEIDLLVSHDFAVATGATYGDASAQLMGQWGDLDTEHLLQGRVLDADGQPVPYGLARVPLAGETRGNLAAGGRGVGVPLSDKDRTIVETVAPRLREHGILFAGLDVIGDFLTEVNVTSPTCIRELDGLFELNISAVLLDCIERKLAV